MLAVQDIEVRYQGASAAVRGVSLEVPDRGVVALLGANGAGKTTILRAIGGLLRFHGGQVTGGAILFDGVRIETRDANQIVRLGIAQALEGRRIFAELTVDENLRAGALASRDAGASRRAYGRVMDLFPVLRERRSQMAGYLSGGEQQMLAIGRALMASPKLLLLDEPSLGLSPFMVRQIGEIITEISAGGTAVLLVEQNAQMALTLASAGYVLETGRVALSGPARELLGDESVRAFYLGLHEGESHANFAALRERRPERVWSV
ncbi:MAG TPA: ABC transporter ATP-binding protein [Ktedonobacterales bacterium]|nr:ABC transporter ATP-binding protein [Ktedonobacterales bacterium]